jgi:hypothetical protein
MAIKKTEPRWLNPREMKAWRSFVVAETRLMEAMDADLAPHELSMADYAVLVFSLKLRDEKFE